MGTAEAARGDYWNDFYRAKAASFAAPSQFALFVLGETPQNSRMLDFGCGTGRDAIYFASQGRVVVGIDGAEAAVEHCRNLAGTNGLHARFLSSRIDGPDLAARIRAELEGAPEGPLTVYARFFVHAINDVEEAGRHGQLSRSRSARTGSPGARCTQPWPGFRSWRSLSNPSDCWAS